MRRVIVSHCWTGHPEFAWYPYIKETLEKKGFQVKIPALLTPEPDAWIATLKETVARPGKNLTLIGHNLGCATVLRYLETAPQPVGNVILVACGTDDAGDAEIAPFYDPPFDFERIRQNAKHFVAFYSDHDFKDANVIFEKLGAEIIILPGREHFTGTEFPELITTLYKLVYGREDSS